MEVPPQHGTLALGVTFTATRGDPAGRKREACSLSFWRVGLRVRGPEQHVH